VDRAVIAVIRCEDRDDERRYGARAEHPQRFMSNALCVGGMILWHAQQQVPSRQADDRH
jgi:hypothetical protein